MGIRKFCRLSATLFLFFFPHLLFGKTDYEIIKLWDNPSDKKEARPELRIFKPQNETVKSKTCILICPGGSYHHLGLTNEGSEVAEYLAQWGVTAVVLRYRVSMRGNHHQAMIEDFQRAMQIVKNHANEWNINIIGAMGFSAGGHLVAMGGATHTNYLQLKSHTKQDIVRPDFICSIYPVVSSNPEIIHQKSFNNLLPNASESEKQDFSLEKIVPNDMPPTFLLACKDDDIVDYRNCECLFNALKEKNINCECHIFGKGGHGFGFIRTKSEETKNWPTLLKNWLFKNGFIEML